MPAQMMSASFGSVAGGNKLDVNEELISFEAYVAEIKEYAMNRHDCTSILKEPIKPGGIQIMSH